MILQAILLTLYINFLEASDTSTSTHLEVWLLVTSLSTHKIDVEHYGITNCLLEFKLCVPFSIRNIYTIR